VAGPIAPSISPAALEAGDGWLALRQFPCSVAYGGLQVSVRVAWYRRGEWARWRTVELPTSTHDEWLDKIEEAIGALEQRGHPVDKLIVVPGALLA